MIYDLERRISNPRLRRERGIVMDAQGNLIQWVEGTPDGVEMRDYLHLTPGKIFSHNHPRGVSFSVADIGFAHRARLAEMRVVCHGSGEVWACSMRPDRDEFGWRRWKQSCIPMLKRMMRERAGYRWNLHIAGNCNNDCRMECHNEQWQACGYLYHEPGVLEGFWPEFAERMGYRYARYEF
jgi:hypothetical protein